MAIGSSQWMYSSGDYEIEQSLRFNDNDGSYLSRTFPSAGNRKTWTWSGWVKRGNISVYDVLFNAYSGNGSTDRASITFNNSNELEILAVASSSVVYRFKTTALYRDSSAWYHVLVALDTAQSTESNRVKIYVNGERVTSFGTETYPPLNGQYVFNNDNTHQIGKNHSTTYSDSYLSEVNFIDGQALTPDSFGETGDYSEWKPIKYAGTYGTNGFYLPFEQDYSVEGMSTVTYEGTGAAQYIGGTGFAPDLTWFKSRSTATNHEIHDTVRGYAGRLFPNSTNAESTSLNGFAGWAPDGFNLDGTGGGGESNTNGRTYVAWNWDMGGTTASNTSGTINSSVRANQAYGQSIVKYTGTGSAATVGHGLASAPDMIICKSDTNGYNWPVYHSGLASAAHTVTLDITAASAVETNKFNGTAPTSSVFSVGTHGTNVSSASQIAYCFHDVTGYSKFGSYTANNSSAGPSITTGFSPAFVIIKDTEAANNWIMYDNTRDPSNPNTAALFPDSSQAEAEYGAIDFNATGFQIKSTVNALNNGGREYIYAAFADTREYAYWYDQSGNNNDWTSKGGLTESDVMVDSPTNNFATYNPVNVETGFTLSEGSLKASSSTDGSTVGATQSRTSGKWYWETTVLAVSNFGVGFLSLESDSFGSVFSANTNLGYGTGEVGVYPNGIVKVNNVSVFTGTSFGVGDILQIAVDLDNQDLYVGVNGTLYNSGAAVSTAIGTSSIVPAFGLSSSSVSTIVSNFGQDSSFAGNKTPQGNQDSNGIGDFYYAPPTGFLSLCTKSLPSVDVIPSEHFNTVTWTGNGSARSITTGVDADLVWTKARNQTYDHNIFDSVRGTLKKLSSNSTGAESSMTNSLTAFNTDGFTLGDTAQVNLNGGTFVAWNWKAGGSASSNTNGSITSSVSANVDAGFSVVSYTGNGSAGATIGHGLGGVIPELVINKRRTSASEWWIVYHSSVCTGDDNWLALNTTGALRSGGESMYDVSGFTSTTFGVNAGSGVNVSGATQIAYCFHSVESYSKVGSYTGNTSSTDGTFVHCGFAVSFLLIKDTGAGNTWVLLDSKRDSINPNDTLLQPQSSAAETTGWAGQVDFLSNGFKIRSNDNGLNAARTYIFYAIAENPFKHTNAR